MLEIKTPVQTTPGLTEAMRRAAAGNLVPQAIEAGNIGMSKWANDPADGAIMHLRKAVVRRFGKMPQDFGPGGRNIHYRHRGDFESAIVIEVIWAAAQEFGTTIRPFRAQYLAIPVRGNEEAHGFSPRDIPDLFPMLSKRGQLMLSVYRGGVLTPMYILKKSVRIKGKEYVAPSVRLTIRDLAPTMVKQIKADLGWKD